MCRLQRAPIATRGRQGMRTAPGLGVIAIGAILAFAVTSSPSFLNLQIAGWVIMLTGVAGIVAPGPVTAGARGTAWCGAPAPWTWNPAAAGARPGAAGGVSGTRDQAPPAPRAARVG